MYILKPCIEFINYCRLYYIFVYTILSNKCIKINILFILDISKF